MYVLWNVERYLLEVACLGRNVAETSKAVISALNACSCALNRTHFCIFQRPTVTFNKNHNKVDDRLHNGSSWSTGCCEWRSAVLCRRVPTNALGSKTFN